MGNAYDYSLILNQDHPDAVRYTTRRIKPKNSDFTKLDELMYKIKQLAEEQGCKITYYVRIWGYLFNLEIKCPGDKRKIIVRLEYK